MEDKNEYSSVDEWLNQGQMLMGAEAFDEADKYFDKVLDADPMNGDAYLLKGLVRADTGQLDSAKDMFNRALMINKNRAECWFHLGNIAFLQDQFNEGVKCFNKAIALGYDNPEVYFHLGLMYEDREDFQEALRCYNKAISMDELTIAYRVRKISLYLAMGRYEEAIQALKELRMIAPDHFDSYHLLAAAYSALGRFNDADEVLKAAEEKFPGDMDLFFDRLRVLAAKGDVDSALEHISRIEDTQLDLTQQKELLLTKGKLLGQTEKLEAAQVCFEQVLAMSEEAQDDGEALYFLMNTCIARGDYEKLLKYAKCAEKTVKTDPYTFCALYYSALASAKMNADNVKMNYRRAIQFYRSVSMENPDRIDAYLFRAVCHRDLKEYDQALEMVDYVRLLQPDNGEIYVIKSSILSEKGDRAGADAALKKAQALGARMSGLL